jgi:hypothetical protein
MALTFSGNTQRIQLSDSISPVRNVAGATVCAWVYLTNKGATNATVVSLTASPSRAANPRIDFFAGEDGGDIHVWAVGRALDGDANQQFISTLSVPINTWSFVSGVWSFSSRYIRLGLNGVYEQSGVLAGWTAGNCSNTATLANTLGNKDSNGNQLNGRMDDTRIYNRVLSDAELQTIFACHGTDGINLGLQARYLFNAKQAGFVALGGETAIDIKGNYNGVISAGCTYAASELKYRSLYQ